MDEEGTATPSGQTQSSIEFENSMTRIHHDLGMELPEWLLH